MSDVRRPEVSFFLFLTCLDATKFVWLSVMTLIETTCLKICSKSQLQCAKSPLPVDVRRSKKSLLKLSSNAKNAWGQGRDFFPYDRRISLVSLVARVIFRLA